MRSIARRQGVRGWMAGLATAAGGLVVLAGTALGQEAAGPEITIPPDITAEQSTEAGAAVEFVVTAATDAGVEVPVKLNIPSGTVFPLGTTIVKVHAADPDSGLESAASFKVTVVDTTAPSIAAPEGIKVNVASAGRVAVNFEYSATDICDAKPTVTAEPESGSLFPMGATEVTVTATDSSGNRSSRKFNVTVVDSEKPGLNVPADKSGNVVKKAVEVPVENATGPKDQAVLARAALGTLLAKKRSAGKNYEVHKIREAIQRVTESLDDRLWETRSTLSSYGYRVFDKEGEAVWLLEDVEGAEGIISMLVQVNELLARRAISDAEAALPSAAEGEKTHASGRIADAKKELQHMASEIEGEKANAAYKWYWFGKQKFSWHQAAILHCKHAWQRAMMAMKIQVVEDSCWR